MRQQEEAVYTNNLQLQQTRLFILILLKFEHSFWEPLTNIKQFSSFMVSIVEQWNCDKGS